MDLTPIGTPPSRFARWCPRCCCWREHTGRVRCGVCGAAVVRQVRAVTPRPGELRPGVVAEFADTRDRYDPRRELAELRARLGSRSTFTGTPARDAVPDRPTAHDRGPRA